MNCSGPSGGLVWLNWAVNMGVGKSYSGWGARKLGVSVVRQ